MKELKIGNTTIIILPPKERPEEEQERIKQEIDNVCWELLLS